MNHHSKIHNNKQLFHVNMYVTRMATLMKVKLKKSDVQTNIDIHRVAANITEYHIISN